MKRSTLLSAALVAACCAVSCMKQALKTTYDKQSTFIESFVKAKMDADSTATLTRTGEAYRVTLHDTLDRVLHRTDSLDWNGQVALYYACFTLTSANITASNLVATNLKQMADAAGWELSDTTRYKLDTLTLDKTLPEGLRNGLYGVQPYDEAFVLFTGEYGFGDSERGTIPARSALVYQIWIASIDND